MSDRWFAHSGDLGDIIYALPAIRGAGGGHLHLFDTPGKTWHGMTQERAHIIIPLLRIQPYIETVQFCPNGHADSTLNGFRDHWRPGRNLADMHLATQGLGPEGRLTRWLHVDTVLAKYPVLFARSDRCRSDAFPWARVYDRYKKVAAFVGLSIEHRRFCDEIGPVPFHPTLDFLDLARVVAGVKLFVGNQSAPAAIAEGLKATMILEVFPPMDNCRFDRMERINVVAEPFELPSVDKLLTC
jgi:hypothetical protein